MTISITEATRVWAKIGLLSFGGPAAQIALMHQELVKKQRWISEERFLNALNFCMLLPGPEAQQLSIYLGWLMHKTHGGLIAGLLFILPGFFCILLLSVLYVTLGNTFFVAALFFGLKAAVLAIVIQAIARIGKKILKNSFMIGITLSSFLALYFLNIPFPAIIATAIVLGIAGQFLFPDYFVSPVEGPAAVQTAYVIDETISTQNLEHLRPSWQRSAKTLLVWLMIWAMPIAAIFATFGADSLLGKQAVFFSNTAVFSFGGAYAVLAYVAQRVVDDYQWISPREMVDGLALAETTPGPLIMVLQFVAFVAAYRHQSDLSPISAGVLASFISVWVTFAPCFLWIFLGAPYIEKLRSNIRWQAALKSITAAVVGVIASLSLWFAMHTLFGGTAIIKWKLLAFELPRWGSIDWPMLCITVIAMSAILKFHISAMKTMLLCSLLGVTVHIFK